MGSACCSCLRPTSVSPVITPVSEYESLLQKLMNRLSEWMIIEPDDVKNHREALQVAGFFGNTPDFETFINHLGNFYDDVNLFRDDYLSALKDIGWLQGQPKEKITESPKQKKTSAYNLFIMTKMKKRARGGDELSMMDAVKAWGNLTIEEKNQWKQKASKMNQ
jgi:hypothetical protein